MLAMSLAKIHLLRILLLIHNQTWSFPFPRYLQYMTNTNTTAPSSRDVVVKDLYLSLKVVQ